MGLEAEAGEESLFILYPLFVLLESRKKIQCSDVIFLVVTFQWDFKASSVFVGCLLYLAVYIT